MRDLIEHELDEREDFNESLEDRIDAAVAERFPLLLEALAGATIEERVEIGRQFAEAVTLDALPEEALRRMLAGAQSRAEAILGLA